MEHKKEKTTSLGGIGNYYGDLTVKEDNGKFFWSIENYDGHRWKEIPSYLYEALIKFNNESLQS